MRGWIGVDLDGTLAQYGSWQGIHHIGEPIAPMIKRVKRWLASGRNVKIMTARASEPDPKTNALIIKHIEAWCEKHIGQKLEVTCSKDFDMITLFDDRAVQVETNTGKILGLVDDRL